MNMAEKRDLYEVLGVSKQSDERELKASYRKLAHQHHPDKNPGDKVAEEKFKEASLAYSVLADPEKRAQYDRFGHAGLSSQGGEDYSANVQDIFGSIFGDLFGGGGGRRRGQGERGADLQYTLQVTFEEAAFGVEKEITIPRKEACQTCNGSGGKAGTKPIPCRTCAGLGEVRVSQGFFAIAQTCPSCQGSGQTISDPCLDCKGARSKKVKRQLSVKVPPGVDEGMQLRFTGEGEGGTQGGGRGNLFVVIAISAHPLFTREDDKVICEVPISFTQAALGAKIEVPTLDGKVSMQIPAGTQAGAVFRLAKKGIPHLRQGRGESRGDQLVKVHLEVPKHLTRRQKDLLIEFADQSGEDNLPVHQGFFKKVKEIFG